MLQKSHAVLRGPVARGRGTHTERPGIERCELNAPALFIGFVSIEGRALNFKEGELGKIQDEARSHHAKAGMRRVLQMMAERRLRILRRRLAMHVGHRAQRGLGRRASIEQPGNFLADRQRVQRRQLGKNVVRMLVIDQRLPMISFARSERARESRDAAKSATPPKTSAGKEVCPTQPMLLHEHKVIRRLRLALAAWPTLLVVGNKHGVVKHQLPAAG